MVPRVRPARRSGWCKDEDYEVDEKKRTISVLEPGITKVEDHLGIDNLYDSVNTPLISFMNNAIKAKELFRNDKEYVVMNGEVLIVDEHTGRMLHGRRYNEGLHQAIEAKEGVTDPRGVPDPRDDHAAELLPHVRQALGHDRHGDDRGSRVRQDLQARRRADPDQPADGPRRPARPGLPHRGGQVRRGRRGHRRAQPARASRSWSAPSRSRSPSCSPVCCKQQGVPHSVLNAKQHAERGQDRRDGRPQGRGHRRDQHGRSRHRHHARWLRRVPRRPGAAQAGPRPGRDQRRVRSRLAGHGRADQGPGRRRARRGPRPRRSLRPGHRAPRVPPHRQPAPRPFRPSGRPGRVPLLPLAPGRADAAVQVRLGRLGAHHAQGPRRRPDREQAGHELHRLRAGPGRGAELRLPQERPQVRRRDETASARSSTTSAARCSRAPTCTSRSAR